MKTSSLCKCFLYIHKYVFCMCVCSHMYRWLYTHVYIYLYTYFKGYWVNFCPLFFPFQCFLFIFLYMYLYICVCVCTCIYECTHIYSFIYIFSRVLGGSIWNHGEKTQHPIETEFIRSRKRYLDNCFIFGKCSWGNINNLHHFLQNLHPIWRTTIFRHSH